MPSDLVDETIQALRSGDLSEIEDDDEPQPPPPETESPDYSQDYEEPAQAVSVPRQNIGVPDVIMRVLNSSAKDELLGMANFLDPRNTKRLTLIFHTPYGEIRTAVDWCSNKPDQLMRGGDNLMMVKVRAPKNGEPQFIPATGAELDISFAEYAGRAKVICLAPPQPIYPGVDLLCFLPQNALVEKTGKLKDAAPSVISGAPSTTVDDDGEPIVEGEKSASVKSVKFGKPPVEDFDKPRE